MLGAQRSGGNPILGLSGYADPVESGDLTGDGMLNVLDVVALVGIILNG